MKTWTTKPEDVMLFHAYSAVAQGDFCITVSDGMRAAVLLYDNTHNQLYGIAQRSGMLYSPISSLAATFGVASYY